MKRLPVYLLLDCSGSMAGEPIQAVKMGLKQLIDQLRNDPHTVEAVSLSIITFSDSAQQAVALTDLASFPEPDLQASGPTALGSALRLLKECIEREVGRASGTQQSDWKPLIFLMTDGRPTDDWEQEAENLRLMRLGNIIACAAGDAADEQLLKRITDSVIKLNDLRSDTLVGFFKWCSNSISKASHSDVSAPHISYEYDRSGRLASLSRSSADFSYDYEASAARLSKHGHDHTSETQPPSAVSSSPQKHESQTSKTDKVHFLVASPPAAPPGRKFIVDVWAHLERQRAEVERRVRQARPQTDLPPVIRPKGPFKIERGTRLFVRLKFQDLHVDPPEDVILWEGEIGNASFEVAIPTEITEGVKCGLVTVHWEGGLQIARVPLQLLVAAKAVPAAPTTQPLHHIRKAFASYASPDRDEVIGRIQGMQKIAPDLDVFLDVVNLRSGEDWEKKLWQVIPESDVFYLFWSAAAKASPWVEKEWRCALNSRGEEFIDPVPLVSPEEVRPPDELSKKHFNDWILAYLREKPKGE